MTVSEVKARALSEAERLNVTKQKDLTVFYDGECPYCRTEIRWYRKLNSKNNIDWVDITRNKTELEDHNIPYNKAMAELHVVESSGQHYVGVPGFFAIWSQLSYYRSFSSVIQKIPIIMRLLNAGYKKFALWRIQRKLK